MKSFDPGHFRPITVTPRAAVTKLMKAMYESWGEAVLAGLGAGVLERIREGEADRLGVDYMLSAGDVYLLHPVVFHTKIPSIALPDLNLDHKHKHALFHCNYSYDEKKRLTKFFFFIEYTQYYEAFMRLENVFHAVTGQRAAEIDGYRLLPISTIDAIFYVFDGLNMDVMPPFNNLEYVFIKIKDDKIESIINFYENR